jgi:ribosomal protein S8
MFLLGDMLARIQNGLLLRRHSVLVLRSRICLEVLKVLYAEGFINGYAVSEKNSNYLIVFLKYIDNQPLIRKFKLISTPSRHMYIDSKKVEKVLMKEGFFVLSTSKYGIVPTTFFRNSSSKIVGGELLFQLIF